MKDMMSDQASSSANPFEDPIAAGHPLDILINAISGSDNYEIPPEAREAEFNLEQLLNSGQSGDVVDNKGKRKREDVTLDARQAKIARSVTSHIIQATASQSDQSKLGRAQRYTPSTFSTIEVWHPTAGQKSYRQERRMLNPPPILRVTGPLLPLLTKATIQTVFTAESAESSTSLSNQTQRIPLVPLPPASLPPPRTSRKGKRLDKEEAKQRLRQQAGRYGFGQTLPFERLSNAQKEREALSEGLGFPGLWVAEGIGRNKEFRLELDLGQPGADDPLANPSTPVGQADQQPQALSQDGVAASSTGTQREFHGLPVPEAEGGEVPAVRNPELAAEDPTNYGSAVQPSPSLNHFPAEPDTPIAGPSSTRDHTWATFVSSPLAVVSKPSQKTAKARSMASCLTVDDSFALWVRIHGQTVRTKFMKVDASDDNASLTTRTAQWTPFRFEVLDRAAPSIPLDRTAGGRKRSVVHSTNILTYGSIGCLVDLQTGIKTEPMRLVRIDKNENLVGTDVGDPVSDLQRVGFVRLVDWQDDYTGGGRWYLSAPGARLGGAELHRPCKQPQAQIQGSEAHTEPIETDPQTLGDVEGPEQQKGKRKAKKAKTKRFALAEAVIAEDAGGAEFALSWTKADRAEGERARGFGKEAIRKVEMCERVEDWMCWTLGGVASFSYSFFDAAESTGGLPEGPIDPVPRSLIPPTFRPEANTLELTMSDFFSNDAMGRALKYEVYLGPIGPLHTATYRSTAPAESNITADGHLDGPQWEAVPYLDGAEDSSQHEHGTVRSHYPCNLPHVIVVVAMPRAEEIIRTMQECFAEAQYQANSTLHEFPGEPTEAEGWLPAGDAQEAAVPIAAANEGDRAQAPDAGDGADAQAQRPNSDDSLPQAELELQRMFHAAQADAETHHNVDDIAAVLAAQATEADFSLAHLEDQFINSNLDPTLHALDAETADANPIDNPVGGSADAEPPSDAQEPTTNDFSNVEQPAPRPPPSLTLMRPDQESKKIEMVPLPLVLVRQSDGTGFGLGRSVVAERVDSKNTADKPRWGLRVVAD